MKRVLVLCALALATCVCLYGKNVKDTSKEIVKLAKSYRNKPGFEVVNLGPTSMSLMKMAAKAEARYDDDDDLDDREDAWNEVDILSGVKRMLVVDYEDASYADKSSFNEKLLKCLEGCELLLSTIDDGEETKIYGRVLDDGVTLNDLIVYEPQDGSLVYMEGKIDIQKALSLAQ